MLQARGHGPSILAARVRLQAIRTAGPSPRPTGLRSTVLIAGLVTVALAGCTLTAIDPDACDGLEDCRRAFGVGSVCGADGFCSAPLQHPRCTRSWPSGLLDRPEDFGDTIVVGSLFDFVEHADTRLAAELPVRQVAGQGGLEGQAIGIVHCDTAAMAGDELDDLEGAASAARFLADAIGVPAIIGPRGSSRTQAVFEAVRDRDVLVISPSATSPALTGIDATDPTFEAPGLLWRTVPPDTLQSEVIAADMLARSATRVAAMYQLGAYGEGLVDLFESRFVADGGELVDRMPFESGQFATTVATLGASVAAGEYDEVLFVSSDLADYTAFLLAASATDTLIDAYASPDVGLFFADAAFNEMLLVDTAQRAAPLYPRIRGTRPASAEGVLFNAFAAAYAAEFDADADSSGFTPHAYDAAWLVLYGIARASFEEETIGGVGIARGLRRVSSGERVDILPTNWLTVVERFRSGASIDVEGASGPLDYDPDTEETTAPISVWAITMEPSTPIGWGFVEIDRVEPGG
ncbi:MAG: ABC transporter substrate-binding protein [Myxococcales bacterium]|nr:ABC transporter substrate-binding protein [Myxococcales bacterium]